MLCVFVGVKLVATKYGFFLEVKSIYLCLGLLSIVEDNLGGELYERSIIRSNSLS